MWTQERQSTLSHRILIEQECEMEVSATVMLGNLKETMKMVFPSLWMEDSWMHTKC